MSREYNESYCWTIEKFSFFHNYFAIIDTADYLADQLFRNQQVMCSSHTTSSKKHRKLRFSMLFLLQKLCACEKVYADTHDNSKIYERDDGSNKQVSA